MKLQWVFMFKNIQAIYGQLMVLGIYCLFKCNNKITFIFNEGSPYLLKYILEFCNKMVIIPEMCFKIIEVVVLRRIEYEENKINHELKLA